MSSTTRAAMTESADELDEYTVLADLPKVNVEFTIDVPEEIEELARTRYERAKKDSTIQRDVNFEDYLLDHVNLQLNFPAATTTGED
jgi:hypothetical protein